MTNILQLRLEDSEQSIRTSAMALRQATAGYERKPRHIMRRLNRLTAKELEFDLDTIAKAGRSAFE